MTIPPKKALGQHFLKDENIARKIIKSLSYENKNIIEIGPGTGVLSKYLLNDESLHVYLIEKDKQATDYLQQTFADKKKRIIREDFLEARLTDIFPKSFCIIGNFPYNISSQIFFKVLQYRNQVTEVVGMIQKEVADRISSPPGNKTYGILSVLLQAYYHIEVLFTVSEKVFYPPPKVKSAVIRLIRNQDLTLACNESLFFTIVKAAFNQRRKTLRNSLKAFITDQVLPQPLLAKRPEELSVDQFVELTNLIKP